MFCAENGNDLLQICFNLEEVGVLGLPDAVHACLFDLDGVLTDTASVHTRAWKAMFDAYLRDRAGTTGTAFVPFDAAADYQKYVDGKKRADGVRSFLASRGIELPDGTPADSPDTETVNGLGNHKNELFQKILHCKLILHQLLLQLDGFFFIEGSLCFFDER